MKKVKLVALSFVTLFACSAVFAGCGGSRGSGKTQIGVSIYNGGHGTAWVESLAAKFMEENPEYNEKYEIVFYPEKKSETDLISEMGMSGSTTQAAITAANKFQSGIYNKNCFEDLSDIISRKVDGNDKTIKDKILNYDLWSEIYSNRGNGMYALPFADCIMGLVIDHQLFIDKGWYEFASAADAAELAAQGITYTEQGGKLIFASSTGKVNYKQGDKILSKGKDGKFGTYDDGQPLDIAGWELMLDTIYDSGSKCFLSSGKAADYTDFILYALFAQLEGTDGWDAYFNYNSNGSEINFITSPSPAQMTVENGYRINEIEGVYKAYEFMSKYMNPSTNEWMHPACVDSQVTHIDAQNYFLLGLGNEGHTTTPQTAMLVEGAWWEYEASAMFAELAKSDESRGYGKREYRYMLLPDMVGQKSEKSCFASCETGVMLIGKDANSERLQCTKDFIAYLLKDDSLSYFTGVTGALMMYDYEIKDSDYAKLTPFAKNMIELYQDQDNIEIVRSRLSCLQSPLSYVSARGSVDIMKPKFGGVTGGSAIKVVNSHTISEIRTGLIGFYKQSDWQKYIQAARDNGFDI